MTFIDIGTGDTTSPFPVKPRVAFDFVVSERVTVGAAANAGYVRISSTSFVPGNGPDAFVVELAPRLGGFFRASEALRLLAPRRSHLGARLRIAPHFGGRVSHQLGADLDAFVVAFLTRDVGIDHWSLDHAAARRQRSRLCLVRGAGLWLRGAARRGDEGILVFSAAVSAGIVLVF